MAKFIPDLLKSDNVVVDDFDLQCKNDELGRKLFTYTVKWHEQSTNAGESDSASEDLKDAEQTFSFMNASSGSIRNIIKNDLDEECRRSAPSNKPTAIEKCRCDGPCGRIKPVSDMRTMGLCEHTICSDCYENAPVVAAEGEEGCPNRECYLTDLACLCTDRQRRNKKFRKIIAMKYQKGDNMSRNNKNITLDSTTDRDENNRHNEINHNSTNDVFHDRQPTQVNSIPCLHMVDVRATTFLAERGRNRIQKKQRIVEMCDNYSLQQAINMLYDNPNIDATELIGFIYYCLNGRVNDRSCWKRITPSDLTMPIMNFENADDRIDIIFDCT